MTVTNCNTVVGCLPELVEAHDALARAGAAVGIIFVIADYGGLRDEATTEQLQEWERQDVAAGGEPYPVAPWGESHHDFGGAFDAKIVSGFNLWPDPLAKLGELAAAAGLVWGGTWAKPHTDRPHFELPLTLEQLRARWSSYHG